MKIPETSANIGAYYGNEENGQWQPNGVIIDSGVGGGVVGSGDAGIHRPVYPVHITRGHIPGYVMAGAYYPPAYPPAPVPQPDDFADYMWMENEEEFDKQVMQQLEEEALMEQCIEAMLEDEQRERHNGQNHPTTSNGNSSLSLEETVSRSTLNPLAAEFVPTFVRATTTDQKQVPPPAPEVKKTREEAEPRADRPALADDAKTDDSRTQPEPPEVSAADVQPAESGPPPPAPRPPTPRGELKKHDPKKPHKPDAKDTKKVKPQVVKSEPKIQPKKKEVRSVRSEGKVDDLADKIDDLVIEPLKPQTPTEEPAGPKPINYAAAAKANKPKKPLTPPTDKLPLKLPEKTDKKIKTEKPVQRKNSAKTSTSESTSLTQTRQTHNSSTGKQHREATSCPAFDEAIDYECCCSVFVESVRASLLRPDDASWRSETRVDFLLSFRYRGLNKEGDPAELVTEYRLFNIFF